MPKNFRGFLAATGIFGLGDFSHALLIFAATTLLTPRFGILHAAEIAGLLYMGRNLIQALASYPIGVLADRWGRRRLLMAGYGTGAATSIVTSLAFISDGPLIPLLALVFVLAGVYVAVQDALEPALAAQYVSKAARSLGFGALGLVSGLGDFVSSIAVGCAWMLVSPAAGFVMAGFLMTVGAVTLAGIEDQP
jgi:MFS family permease